MRKFLISTSVVIVLAIFSALLTSSPAASAAQRPAAAKPAATRLDTLRTIAAPLTEHVRVKTGDTLSLIAKRVLGSASKWPELWWPNRHKIADPNTIFTGQRLTIPARQAKLSARQLHIALDAAGAIQVGPPAGNSNAGTTTTVGVVTHSPPAPSPQPANSSCAQWAASILSMIGAPANGTNENSLCTWTVKEDPWNAYGPDGAEYTHNPLNVVDAAGAVGYVNSIGVGIYPDWATGNADTVSLLDGFPDIIGRLKAGLGLCGWYSASFSAWSGGGYSEVC